MTTYIQLLTLTPEGREKVLRNPESVLRAQDGVKISGIQVLGLYGVLGEYDFVSMVEAPDNEAIARYSLELGVQAGVSITTLPAIPIARLEGRQYSPPLEARLTETPPPK
ncbi:MAG: GYD domain-containing protein [Dehalococcoidia bacterium]|nr:GYD domain-containing protein [Chloroflexota bacterium]